MPDPTVARWKQQGRVYLWRYKENRKNYPGWHFTADAVACNALLELFELMFVRSTSRSWLKGIEASICQMHWHASICT
jgi:hypothetical protein